MVPPTGVRLAFVAVLVNHHMALGLAVVVALKLPDKVTGVFTANTSLYEERALIVAANVVFGPCAELPMKSGLLPGV
ncbi:MAG: hypothetical protein ACJ74Z_10975 [Bryobacteraceae bacterium]